MLVIDPHNTDTEIGANSLRVVEIGSGPILGEESDAIRSGVGNSVTIKIRETVTNSKQK